MNHQKEIKQLICQYLRKILDQKVEAAQVAISSAKEARGSDTKSSAGDKYETGRAMMQMELEKNEIQLNKALALKKEISGIKTEKQYDKVEFGSIVITNEGNYFISVGLGKVEIEGQIYYAVSLASPVGNILQDKIVGDKVEFQDRVISIIEIY